MLYRDDLEACCAYCRSGHPLGDGEIVCERRGIVRADGSCSRFRYDPLRRVPGRPVVLQSGEHSGEDFSL